MQRWSPDLANAAFCATTELRRKILERQSSLGRSSSVHQGLEPSTAEFIAALAAGIESHCIVQVGCGISTIALAVAAQATGGCLISIHTDEAKQDIVRHHLNYLGLLKFVEFIVSKPNEVLLARKNVDFAHLTGDPKDYVELFGLLHLNDGAVVTADNALSEACNEYAQHVRQQPGMDSSTLPLARGLEVTKVASFRPRRKVQSSLQKGVLEEVDNRICLLASNHEERTTSINLRGYAGGRATVEHQFNARSCQRSTSAGLELVIPDNALFSCTISKTVVSKLDFPRLSVKGLHDSPKVSAAEGSSSDLMDSHHDKGNCGCDEVNGSCSKQVDASSGFSVHFENHGMETEVSITGINRDMLLADITTAFSDMGISVKTANISTLGTLIKDVFFVTDAKSGAPIHPSRWNNVRERILRRIGLRSNSI